MLNYSDLRKRYYLPMIMKIIFGASSLFFLLSDVSLIYLIIDPSFLDEIYLPANLLLFVGCLFLIAWISWCLCIFFVVLFSYLEFTPEGVICKFGFSKIYSPWNNITKIARMTKLRMSTQFFLRNSAISTVSFDLGVAQMQAVIELRPLLAARFSFSFSVATTYIPFLLFVPKSEWEEGPLRLYFYNYAPHLLDDAG